MTKESKQRFRRIYGILLSISLAAAGICLMAACVGIYQSGENPFTRASVATAFQAIAIPVYISIAMVLAGFVLELFIPADNKRPKPEKQDALILQRLHSKTDLQQCDAETQAAVQKQQKQRRLHKLITAGLLAIGTIVFLCYGLNIANFPDGAYNEAAIRGVLVMLGCLVLPFGYSIFTVYFCRASIRKEIQLLKEAGPTEYSPAPAEFAYAQATKGQVLRAVRIAVLVISVTLVIMGLMNDGTRDVLAKAIKICTECVGLG